MGEESSSNTKWDTLAEYSLKDLCGLAVKIPCIDLVEELSKVEARETMVSTCKKK